MKNDSLDIDTKEDIINNLLGMLSKDNELVLPADLSLEDKRFFIDVFILLRSQGAIDEDILNLQNKLLSDEKEQRKIDISNLDFHKNIASNCYCITDIETDIAIVFTNNLFTDTNHLDNNIDNLLIKRGGLQIQEELAEIFLKDYQILSYQKPYIVNGHNLACKKLAKIIIRNFQPIIDKDFKKTITQNLEQVFNYAKENKFKSISINLNYPTSLNNDIAKHIIFEECKKLNKKFKFKLIFLNYDKKF